MANAEIKAVITADDQASKVIAGVGNNVEKTSKGINASVLLAGAAVVGFGAMAVKSFSESEKGTAQLNAVLASTKGIAGVTAKAVTDLSAALQKVTQYSDEEITSAQNMLLTFTRISKDIFPDTTKAVLDMSTAMGTDLKSTSIQVGKALQDPINGVTALQRVGVRLTEGQKDLVKQLVESGDTMGAQKIILQELQTEFGGSAEAAGKTFAGQLAIAKNKADDLMESLGGIIVKALIPLLDNLNPLVDKLQNFSDNHPQVVTAAVAIAAAITAIAVAGNVATTAVEGLRAATLLLSANPLIAIGVAVGAALLIADAAFDEIQKKNEEALTNNRSFYEKLRADALANVNLTAQQKSELVGKYNKAEKDAAQAVIDDMRRNQFLGLRGMWEDYQNWFSKIVFTVVSFNMQILNNVMGAWNLIKIGMSGAWNAIVTSAGNAVNGIVGWFSSLPGRIASAISSIPSILKNIIGGTVVGGRPLRDLVPGFASGVQNFGGGLAVVGERGAELVNLPRGSDVIPNNQIAQVSGGNNTTININVGLMTGSAIERREAAMKMFEDLKDIAGMQGQTVGQMIGAA